MGFRRFVAPLMFGLILFAGSGKATSITATSLAGWLQNAANPVDVFGGVTINGSYSTSAGKSLSNSSSPSSVFNVTGPDGSGWSLNSQDFRDVYGYTEPALYGANDGKGSITITMPAGGENALLLEAGTASSMNGSEAHAPITIKLSDGESFTPAAGIWAISISHDVSWLTISTTSSYYPVLADLRFASSTLAQDAQTEASPTVEAATFALIGGGLLILIGGRRKFFASPAD